jgi:hypothetical protein
MSSSPDQNAAMQAMMQAGNAMAQGFSQFFAAQQKLAAPTPAAPAWLAESEALKTLQQEWMSQHAKLWQGMLGRAPDQPGDAGGRVPRQATSASTIRPGRKARYMTTCARPI